MSKQLIVCASNWPSFVASLKQNLKLGYGLCNKTEFRNGFFTASLSQGKDKSYIAKLTNMSGEEKENVVDLCDFLGSCFVPFPKELVTRINDVLGQAEENKQKEAVNTTIKRVRKPRKEKK